MSLSPGGEFLLSVARLYLSLMENFIWRSLASVNLNSSGNVRTCPSSSPGSLLPEEGEDYVSEPSAGAKACLWNE